MRTADLATTKIMWNSVISTPNAKYMFADVKHFYLGTPLDRFEYTRMPMHMIPQEFIDLFGLAENLKTTMFLWKSNKGYMGSYKMTS